ncbi:hypothetical protein CGZ94_16360 [Enemella evansiae]|uniref:HTH lysR-type domain-containing protein n=1 Tax=Enemella evansiae TaxID=2016499 RepID=A0A255G8N7_9ACTN|nr:serine hydrolase [Enemella evansiae]OYO10583.1 hypothetical protein CGZ94_16360 [Enemella evansiae]
MDLLKHLRYFVAVARTEHIGRAAEELDLAQPALSQRVKALEAHLGVPLVEKAGRGIRLTHAGHRVAERAAAVVDSADGLANGLVDADADAIPVGVPATLTPARLHAMATALDQALTPRNCVLQPIPAAERGAALRAGRIAAALLPTPAAGDLSLPLGIALPPRHPLAGMPALHPSDLSEHRLLILDEDAGLREVLTAELDRHGYDPGGCVWDTPPTAALARALAGEPCLTDPRHALDGGLHWVPLVGLDVRRRLNLVWRAGTGPGEPSRAVAALAATLEGDVAPRSTPRPSQPAATVAQIRDVWRAVGVVGGLHARDLRSGAMLAVDADDAWPMASVAKVPLGIALHRAADAGLLGLDQALTLRPDGRTSGTTGISAMADPVRLSLRDALYLALTISDNAAADAIWDTLGADRVQHLLRQVLPPDQVRLGEATRDLYDRLTFGGSLDGPYACRATAAGATRMLELIWSDQAASPAACAAIRDLMRRQVWAHRLASGFPAADLEVAGKTGTAGDHRHEIGVVSYPDGRRYAVAVFTRLQQETPHHRWDWAISETARLAVNALRRRDSDD